MPSVDRAMPEVMCELHKLTFDYRDGNGIDFEPYADFLAPDETRDWIRAWTGNKSLDGAEFLVFGQDGTGGLAAFWCVRSDVPILKQPIVFMGSEGERGVLARDFDDYLWLLAADLGPFEALAYAESDRPANAEFSAFAMSHAHSAKKSPAEVLAVARAEFPNFGEVIDSICR